MKRLLLVIALTFGCGTPSGSDTDILDHPPISGENPGADDHKNDNRWFGGASVSEADAGNNTDGGFGGENDAGVPTDGGQNTGDAATQGDGAAGDDAGCGCGSRDSGVALDGAALDSGAAFDGAAPDSGSSSGGSSGGSSSGGVSSSGGSSSGGSSSGGSSSGGSSSGWVPLDSSTDATCVLTQGYWANHKCAWKVQSLQIGSRTYDQSTLLSFLANPPKGDASLILASQLIAALLNGGATDSHISTVVASAQSWMVANDDGDGLPFGVMSSSVQGAVAVSLGTQLDAWNNGEKETPHCN